MIDARDVDEYINSFPDDIQDVLKEIRRIIREVAPEAEESIVYGIPSYTTHGRRLVHFAANKKHIGFYATPSGHQEFAKELSAYKGGKGSVQFPYDKPIPYDMIRLIVEFRLLENSLKGKKIG
jgi:uncharacterized protein YdhG (YjbR/CyaY superfamily)